PPALHVALPICANEHLGFDADLREYDVAAEMLKQLGIETVTLLSNNPRKIRGLESEGLTVNRRSHIIEANVVNKDYLKTKKDKLGDRKSTRLNSSHVSISYAVFCL